jgi:hypothetical protein
MTNFKRVLLVTKLTKKQLAKKAIKNLNLMCFDKFLYTQICKVENVPDFLIEVQGAGIFCRIIVIDEIQFAAGNGVITESHILNRKAA